MNKAALSAGLQSAAAADGRDPSEIIFLRLLDQVWQIDWTIAPYDVWVRMLEYDIPYFKRFMDLDRGDEAAEAQLIIDWVNARMTVRGSQWKDRIVALFEEVNRLREHVKVGSH